MNDALPLSAAQLGIWLGQQLDRDNPCYWTAEYVELHGALDVSALERAIQDAVAESPALDMRFYVADDLPRQRPCKGEIPALIEVDFSEVDFSAIADTDRLAHAHVHAQTWMAEQLQNPADLEWDGLWKSALLKLQPDHHLWFLQAHHIVLDGYGFSLFMGRVAAGYAQYCQAHSSVRALKPFHPVVMADQQYRASDAFEQDRQLWCELMQNLPAPARLAPAQPVSRQVERCRLQINGDTLQQWQRAARLQQVDFFCWLNAAVALWLYDQTGRVNITLGIPVMNRLGSPALNVACMHMNIVPLPLQIDPARNFSALLTQVQQRWRTMRPHLRYRYEQLKQDLQFTPEQRLFGPVLNLMPFDRPLQFADLTAQVHPLSAGPVEDLAINIVQQQNGCTISLEGNPACYSAAVLESHLAQLIQQLQHCTRLDPRPLQERIAHNYVKHLLLQSAPPHHFISTICERLLRIAREHPQSAAIKTPQGHCIRYGQLLADVQSLAGNLVHMGITPGNRVALLLPRSPDAIVAMLAVLWTGAAYVPLDPHGPAQRRQNILQHAQPALLISDSVVLAQENIHNTMPFLLMDQLKRQALAPLPLLNPRNVHPATAAYLIYTSGSTGTPNGVVISQGALSHFIAAASERYGITAQDCILQFAPLHFDASVEEIFLALGNGASLLLRNDDMLTSWETWLTACEKNQVTVLDLPTAYWHEWVHAINNKQAQPPATIRTVIIGGEAALPGQVQRWRTQVRQDIRLINTYGPTETTVVCTCADLAGPAATIYPASTLHPVSSAQNDISIGEPLPGIQCLLLDNDLQPVAAGETGELCILGPTLANGYWQNDALTASRFTTLQHWPDQPRIYRSGDRARRDEHGQLIHLGRLDNEVKISGQRISPAAVESVLSNHPGIRECAVLALPHHAHIMLVAFIAADDALDTKQLRIWLQPQLLSAAIPAHFIVQSHLPKNANNKIDRKILQQQWSTHKIAESDTPTPDFSALEILIAAHWHALLGQSPRSPQDDFFSMGGKSLQAIQLANRLSQQLKHSLSAALIFSHPTLGELAQVIAIKTQDHHHDIATIDATDNALAPLIELQSGTGIPLFCIHPADGLSWCYLGLTRQLPHTRIMGIQSPSLLGNTAPDYETLLDFYLTLIRQTQPHGPYRLLGWSSGGGVAHGLAAALQTMGETVDQLILLDAYPADHWREAPAPTRHDALLTLLDDISLVRDSEGRIRTEAELITCLQQPGSSLSAFDSKTIMHMIDTALLNMQLFRRAQHPVFKGDILFFRAARRAPGQPGWQGWREYVQGHIEIISLDCDHFSLHHSGPMNSIGHTLAQRLHSQPNSIREPA